MMLGRRGRNFHDLQRVASEFIKSAESPGGAWRLLNELSLARLLKEKHRLAETSDSMKMERKALPRVHHAGG